MKNKIFIACDTTSIKEIRNIIKTRKSKKLKVGYKFGLEFLNSKNGRTFIKKLKNEITFGDFKFSDIPNTCSSAIRAISDLNFNYLTIHIRSGLSALLFINAKVASITSPRLWGGMLVAIPTAIPPAPLTNMFGYWEGSTSGSFSVSS